MISHPFNKSPEFPEQCAICGCSANQHGTRGVDDPVKAKIIELLPDLQLCSCEQEEASCLTHNGGLHLPIRLAEVLRAIEKANPNGAEYANIELWFADSDKKELAAHIVFWHPQSQEEKLTWWNLTADFDGQSDEVKRFIGSLIGV